MRRSPTLPVETVAAITLVVVASLAAVLVLVRDVTDDADTERLAVGVADPSSVPASPSGAADPTASASPDAPDAPREPASPPAESDAAGETGPAPDVTTTSTTTAAPEPPPPTRTSPPTSRVAGSPPCPGLESETYWVTTGEPSTLLAGAGGRAEYAEVVTNGGDEPCTLETNRCGSTAELHTMDGGRVDVTESACPDDGRPVVLEPGAALTEQLSASFPVPPGTYSAHIRRYDGTVVALPVQLDDRIPACSPDELVVEVNGSEQTRQRSELRSLGLRLDLVVLASQDCSVRTVESRVHLEHDDDRLEIVDATDRWQARVGELDDRILTHTLVPASDIPAGDHDGRVTLVLESGERLSAPFTLRVV